MLLPPRRHNNAQRTGWLCPLPGPPFPLASPVSSVRRRPAARHRAGPCFVGITEQNASSSGAACPPTGCAGMRGDSAALPAASSLRQGTRGARGRGRGRAVLRVLLSLCAQAGEAGGGDGRQFQPGLSF